MNAQTFPSVSKLGFINRLLSKIAAVDEEMLRQCPPQDYDNARAIAHIMVLTWAYQAALFFMIGQKLFTSGGELRPELLLVALFIATFILLIDSYMVMRSGWHLSGIAELKRGGLDISGGRGARIKANVFLAIRVLLSIGLAQLTAVFLSLLVFGADISAYNQSRYLRANADIIASASAQVDAEIRRVGEAVRVESASHSALSGQVLALRQNEVDPSANDPQMQQAQAELTQLVARKADADDEVRAAELFAANELGGVKGTAANSGRAGYGLRYRAASDRVANARAHAAAAERTLQAARVRVDNLRKQVASTDPGKKQQSHEQLPGFEHALAGESAELTRLQDQLAKLTRGREEAIRTAVENAPNHVGLDHGFLAQITALEHIAEGDSKIATIVILIDVVSFGFELAAVLAKVTSYVPTSYAALLARDVYLRIVRITDELVSDLERQRPAGKQPEPTASHAPPKAKRMRKAANDNLIQPIESADDPGAPPPRRPRGRPRKHPVKGDAKSPAAQGTSEGQPAR